MSIGLDITGGGDTRFFESAENIAANTRFGVEKAWWRSGKDLVAEFKRQVIAKDKTGRLYIVKKGGRRYKHIASAEGETPANMTGLYRKSISFKVNGAHQLTFGNTAEHSIFLEVGTSRMKPRKGLGNTVKATERDIIRNLSSDISEAI